MLGIAASAEAFACRGLIQIPKKAPNFPSAALKEAKFSLLIQMQFYYIIMHFIIQGNFYMICPRYLMLFILWLTMFQRFETPLLWLEHSRFSIKRRLDKKPSQMP